MAVFVFCLPDSIRFQGLAARSDASKHWIPEAQGGNLGGQLTAQLGFVLNYDITIVSYDTVILYIYNIYIFIIYIIYIFEEYTSLSLIYIFLCMYIYLFIVQLVCATMICTYGWLQQFGRKLMPNALQASATGGFLAALVSTALKAFDII